MSGKSNAVNEPQLQDQGRGIQPQVLAPDTVLALEIKVIYKEGTDISFSDVFDPVQFSLDLLKIVAFDAKYATFRNDMNNPEFEAVALALSSLPCNNNDQENHDDQENLLTDCRQPFEELFSKHPRDIAFRILNSAARTIADEVSNSKDVPKQENKKSSEKSAKTPAVPVESKYDQEEEDKAEDVEDDKEEDVEEDDVEEDDVEEDKEEDVEEDKEDKSRPFACDLCPQRYLNKYHLVRHINSAHMSITYPCDMCPKTYRRQDTLKQHKDKAHEK